MPGKAADSGTGVFKSVMHARAVHLLAFFILIYVGVEVTIGGAESLYRYYDQI